MTDALVPLKLEKWENQGVKIYWNDGHIGQYRSGWLRLHCPCAGCREAETQVTAPPTGLKMLPTFNPASEQLASLTPVGQYAYNISFKDGHDTGIYAFGDLRSICECSECRPKDGNQTG